MSIEKARERVVEAENEKAGLPLPCRRVCLNSRTLNLEYPNLYMRAIPTIFVKEVSNRNLERLD
ncbi:hypothetical protein V9K92_00990 [Phyllobacterium sp. CCNWLW109]|uniref:hypothetical protein n=1 Tax=Phyllobacterium sp. CCNWLW109 TaxID=3127479 RepID=UPI003077236A